MDQPGEHDPNELAFQEELKRLQDNSAAQPAVPPELVAMELFKSPAGRGELDRLCDSRVEKWYLRDLERLRLCAKAVRHLLDTGQI